MQAESVAPRSSVATHCPYCAMQCGMHLAADPGRVSVFGDPTFPVNQGGLCVKGWSAAALLDHAERLRTPLVRAASGSLEPATWEAAIERVAARFTDIKRRHGADAVAVFG